MALFKTNEDIQQEIEDILLRKSKWIYEVGLKIEMMSTDKGKEIIKMTKANPATEFIANKDDENAKYGGGVIIMCIYEEAWDRLNEDNKEKIVELAMVGVSYDMEKGKLMVCSDSVRNAIALCQKYGYDAMQIVETAYLVISQIKEDEKEKKEAEKMMKASKKQG